MISVSAPGDWGTTTCIIQGKASWLTITSILHRYLSIPYQNMCLREKEIHRIEKIGMSSWICYKK